MAEGLGKKLKKLRISKGMTQDMVAKILHTTRQRYARMENGQADIPYQDIRMLADIFGISTSELTAEEQKENIRGILTQQKPELLQIPGMEQLVSLFDIFQEQERIYQHKNGDSINGITDNGKKYQVYGVLRQIQRPAAGWMMGNRVVVHLEEAGLEVIRYPLGEPALLGILVYSGVHHLLITNTLLPMAEEMQAAAFLAGIYFTKASEQRPRFYVLSRKLLQEQQTKETEAGEFAMELLVPGYELHHFIRYGLQVFPSKLRAIHVVQIQYHFQISYETAEKALLRERLVSGEQVKKIHKGRRYYGEKRLADMLGLDVEFLNIPWNRVYVPHQYLEHLLNNFENGYVPFIQLEQAMDRMQIPIKELAGLRKPQDDRDNWDEDW